MLQPLSVSPTDPDFLNALNRRLADLATGIESASKAAAPVTVGAKVSSSSGTRKQRLAYPAAQLDGGSVWWETDTHIAYVVDVPSGESHQWKYFAGTMRGVLGSKPTLTSADAGLLYFATDYARTFRWTGSAWENAPGELVQGAIAFFETAPGTGWSVADGASATYTTATAGTTSRAKPNLVDAYLKGAASYSATQVAAVDGTVSGSTSSSGAHTHTVSATISGSTGTATVQSGSGASVASTTHTHPFSAPTDSQGAHTHTLTGLTITGSEPAHLDALAYVRL